MHLKQLERTSSLSKLKRFLLYGRTDAMVALTLQFNIESLNEIRSIFEELKSEEISVAITAIHDIHDFALKTERYKVVIPFVLAILSKFPEHRHLAYKTAWTLLKTFEEFVYFVKFTEQIPPFENDEILKDAIQNWCDGHDPKTLAEMHARVQPEYEGYSLKRIMVMGNVFSSDDPKRGVVYEFVHHGAESAMEKYLRNNDNVAVHILDYLFNFSRLDDLELSEALLIISEHEFKREQISSTLLASVCTWTRLICYIDLEELIICVEALCTVLFFKNIRFVDMLYYYLQYEHSILSSKIHPNKSLIAEKKMSHRLRKSSDLRLVASKLEDSLKTQKKLAFQNIQKSEIDVTVIIDCHVLDEKTCAKYVKGSEAAAMIACSLTHLARDSNILTFNGFKEINLRCESFIETVEKIEALSGHKTFVKAVRNYLKDDTSSHLYVFVGHKIRHTDYFDLISQDNFIGSKFVFCNLEENYVGEKIEERNDILVVSGFTATTCEVIEGFATYI